MRRLVRKLANDKYRENVINAFKGFDSNCDKDQMVEKLESLLDEIDNN
jgi:hypothetical protein